MGWRCPGAAAHLTEREEDPFKGGFLKAGFRPEGALLYSALEARMWKLISIAMRPGCEGFGLTAGLPNPGQPSEAQGVCVLCRRSLGEL